METILLNNLSKTYPGGKEALRHMSLSLGPGEVFGFLGPNGAGKTTTVKLLNGILTPTEGFCQVLGTDPAKNPEKAHGLTGVVTEHAQMYNHLTGLDNLLFYASVFNIPAQEGKNGPWLFWNGWALPKPEIKSWPPILQVCGKDFPWPAL